MVKTYYLKLGQSFRKPLVARILSSKSDSALSSCDNYIMNDENKVVADDEVIEKFYFAEY